MTQTITNHSESSRRLWRSTAAVLIGFLAVVIVSLSTDAILHVVKFYPPLSEPMNDPVQNFVALSYRCIYAVAGSYIAAWIAPRNPMPHALILGAIGFVLSIVGAVGAIELNLGPAWYPLALVVTALPCAWLGGLLFIRFQHKRIAK